MNKRSGQAMLIAVLSLGGAILGATTVAGLLTLYQIRATTDTQNSAKAIFAADAGTEWALFSYYCAEEGRCSGLPAKPAFAGSGATVSVNCYGNLGASGNAIACNNSSTASAISSGVSNGAERAFFVGVAGVSSTYYP
ncbi:MAG TPA: hypothetical protein VMA75_04470 [Candidatus Paceibacterota bacterium]|nr:hypothetical protein [Candidatus Paceibacterota bacterium]